MKMFESARAGFRFFFVMLGLLLTLPVSAEEHCETLTPQVAASDAAVRLLVHAFAPGEYDLAIQTGEGEAAVRRISFSASNSACWYQPLALARGGDWGWHLVWMEQDKGLFYARMDGAAWVSSPKKRLGPTTAFDVSLMVADQRLELLWQDEHGVANRRHSDDGGRSWD